MATAKISSALADTSMLSDTLSAISPPFGVRECPFRRPEVADVYALRPPDPHHRYQRLMDVTEVCTARLDVLDVAQEVLAPPLRLAGQRVEAELGDRRRDVRAENVDLAEAVHLGPHLVLRDLTGHVQRRR